MAMKKSIADLAAPEPPDHISESSKTLWRAVVDKPMSAGRQAMLTMALEALDRANQARALVDKEGLTTITKSTGAVHVHPALKIERENRVLFIRIWETLHLYFDNAIDGRIKHG